MPDTRPPIDAPLQKRPNKRTGAPLRRMAAYKLPPALLDEASRLSRLPGEPTMTAVVEDALKRYIKAATKRHPATPTEGA